MTSQDIALINKIRLEAFEELRQDLKWAPWPISSLAILEKSIAHLTATSLPQRYISLVKQEQT